MLASLKIHITNKYTVLQEDDMDGIHIVAFAEEEDPGLSSLVQSLSWVNVTSKHKGNEQYNYIHQKNYNFILYQEKIF